MMCVISLTFTNKKMFVPLPNQIRRNLILTKGQATPKYFLLCGSLYFKSGRRDLNFKLKLQTEYYGECDYTKELLI